MVLRQALLSDLGGYLMGAPNRPQGGASSRHCSVGWLFHLPNYWFCGGWFVKLLGYQYGMAYSVPICHRSRAYP